MRWVLYFWVFFLLLSNAHAAQKFEITADDLSKKGEVTTARGNAMVLSNELQIFADLIELDNTSKNAILKGNVRIYRDKNLFVDADFVGFNIESKQFLITPFYAQDGTNGLWLLSREAHSSDDFGDGKVLFSKDFLESKNTESNSKSANSNSKSDQPKYEKYHLDSLTISGCSIENPAWQIDASSGTWHRHYEILSVWNPRLYIAGVPIFYAPYLFFPTGNKRKTGLLAPDFGLSNREGFLFSQPLFIAPYNLWDATFAPQIRTSRGFGLNSEFRLSDELNNVATLKIKNFRNKDSYKETQNLKNSQIFGAEFSYKRRGILAPLLGVSDTIYANAIYMNDIDYMRLDSLSNAQNAPIERLYYSHLNYFVQSENHYFGSYFKYALDTASLNNAASLQTLPTLHYHKFIASLWRNNIIYSLDFKSQNVTRKSGYGYIQNMADIPAGISLNFGALNLSGFVHVHASNVNFNNTQNTLDPLSLHQLRNNANFALLDYELAANIDLARAYENFFHTIHFEALLAAPLKRYFSSEFSKESYTAYANFANAINLQNTADFFNPSDILSASNINTTLDLKAIQYFYNNAGKELFYYKITQRLMLDSDQKSEDILAQNLKNELGFSPISGLNLSASAFYSHKLAKIEESSLSASFARDDFWASMSYYFKINPQVLESGKADILNNHTKFFRAAMRYDFGAFAAGAGGGYDAANNYLKDYYFYINRDIRCFGFGLRFASEVRPVVTQKAGDPIQVVNNNYIRFEFRIVPLSALGVGYRSQSAPRTP